MSEKCSMPAKGGARTVEQLSAWLRKADETSCDGFNRLKGQIAELLEQQDEALRTQREELERLRVAIWMGLEPIKEYASGAYRDERSPFPPITMSSDDLGVELLETTKAESEALNDANKDIHVLKARAAEMKELLEHCLDREWNPFEPDNQSRLYGRIKAVLSDATLRQDQENQINGPSAGEGE